MTRLAFWSGFLTGTVLLGTCWIVWAVIVIGPPNF